MGARHWRENQSLSADLRDALTRRRLVGAVKHLAGVEVVEFSSDWWDGQAHTPCLIVRGGRRHRLLRVVEDGGQPVVVPYDRKRAKRRLASRRQPSSVELGIPAQRGADDIVVDAMRDVLRCTTPSCGALLPAAYADGCPLCGGEGASDEKSTATGARVAGSSTSK